MCESATKWVREGGSRVLTQGGKVTAAGRAKGRVRKGRNGRAMGGVQVSGTDYPWEAINLPRESDTPTCKQTPGESSPLLTSFVFFKKNLPISPKHHVSHRQSRQTPVSRGVRFKYRTSCSGVLQHNTSNTVPTSRREGRESFLK